MRAWGTLHGGVNLQLDSIEKLITSHGFVVQERTAHWKYGFLYIAQSTAEINRLNEHHRSLGPRAPELHRP